MNETANTITNVFMKQHLLTYNYPSKRGTAQAAPSMKRGKTESLKML